MAASGIIENIRVNNPEVPEEDTDAMEERKKKRHPRTEDEKSGAGTDRERPVVWLRFPQGRESEHDDCRLEDS